MYVGQWSVFHGPVILPYILTVWWTNVIIEILVPCDAKIYLIKCNVGQWPTFHGSVISWRLFDRWMLYWRYWLTVTKQLTWSYICSRSVTYISWSTGPLILCCILKTIWWTNVIIGILDPCDAKIYLIKYMWVSDLQFMVQWFRLISWRLFDGWMLYWRYRFSVTRKLKLYK